MALSVYFVLFQQLENFPIRTWDESTYAVNAYEMIQNGDYITPHINGNQDNTWNTKPPLLIWFQIIFIKLLGFNELAIRLPSAIATAITALLIFIFIKKRFSIAFAYSSFFVFISSIGISDFHTGRTGDTDALFTLFAICAIAELYKWLKESTSKSLLLFFIYLTLCFLTKSIAFLMFCPGFLLTILLFKKIKETFFNKYFVFGLIVFFLVIISYVVARNHNGEYIKGIINNEVSKLNSNTAQVQPFDFYFNNLFSSQFSWAILLIPGILLMFKDETSKIPAKYLLIILLSHHFALSLSNVKLYWYILPEISLLSIISSFSVFKIITLISPKHDSKSYLFIISIIFVIPVYFASRQSFKSEIPLGSKKDEALSNYCFKNKDNGLLNKIIVLTQDFEAPILFYKYLMNTKGMDFKIVNNIENLPIDSIIIVSEDKIFEQLEQHYEFNIISENKYVKRLRLRALKIKI